VCFSPQADFVAGAAVAGVGVETLRRVSARRELIVGALPLLFGVHQLVEGFVWLGLRGQVSRGLGDAAKEAYIVYAHAVLPAIVPLGFMLLEPDRRRSRVMMAMACVGALLGVYLLWQVAAYPVGAYEQARCIDYTTHTPNDALIGLLYIAVTCGPALISSSILAMVRPGQSRRGDLGRGGSSRRADFAVVCVRRDRERSYPRAFSTATGVRGTCDLRPGVVLLGSAAGPAGRDAMCWMGSWVAARMCVWSGHPLALCTSAAPMCPGSRRAGSGVPDAPALAARVPPHRASALRGTG